VIGAAMACGLNIIKILWLKKAIKTVTNIADTRTAQIKFQLHYFLRLVFTGLVLLVSALLPFVNFVGTAMGLFTLTISMHLLRFFVPPDTPSPETEITEKDE